VDLDDRDGDDDSFVIVGVVVEDGWMGGWMDG